MLEKNTSTAGHNGGRYNIGNASMEWIIVNFSRIFSFSGQDSDVRGMVGQEHAMEQLVLQ